MIGEYKIPADARPGTMAPDYYLALIRIQQNKIDEAIAFLEKDIDRLKSQRLNVLRDYKLLAKLHEQSGNHKSANYALQAFISLQDSLQADQAKYGSLSFETEQELSAKELSISKLQSENKISGLSRNFSIGIAVLLFVLAGSIYNRLRSKRRANEILENTLSELKSTQVQLIQTEKMASLGELTAGIAHEIQNPLNFVNNFSEVSHELIDEMKEELVNGNAVEAIAIADDVKQNLEKISHHGKRADAIVKSMLQHSQSSTGAKEPTDINALCDEYLRLAYHGLRAKDNAFNAAFTTDFDSAVGMVQVIPQEMGRVLLNLINNAFYAVAEKCKTAGPHYQPAVSISTRKLDNKVEISVADNGNGIPGAIREKIFQPFFTTKPTGQGTGLGLSLSYDIVKAHGGELKVETKEGEGSLFIIQIPV
jgi:signal transduction histidine kinase